MDALVPADRMTMETARMIREDFLQQNAFIDDGRLLALMANSTACLIIVLQYDAKCRAALGKGAELNGLFNIARARGTSAARRWSPQDEYDERLTTASSTR